MPAVVSNSRNSSSILDKNIIDANPELRELHKAQCEGVSNRYTVDEQDVIIPFYGISQDNIDKYTPQIDKNTANFSAQELENLADNIKQLEQNLISNSSDEKYFDYAQQLSLIILALIDLGNKTKEVVDKYKQANFALTKVEYKFLQNNNDIAMTFAQQAYDERVQAARKMLIGSIASAGGTLVQAAGEWYGTKQSLKRDPFDAGRNASAEFNRNKKINDDIAKGINLGEVTSDDLEALRKSQEIKQLRGDETINIEMNQNISKDLKAKARYSDYFDQDTPLKSGIIPVGSFNGCDTLVPTAAEATVKRLTKNGGSPLRLLENPDGSYSTSKEVKGGMLAMAYRQEHTYDTWFIGNDGTKSRVSIVTISDPHRDFEKDAICKQVMHKESDIDLMASQRSEFVNYLGNQKSINPTTSFSRLPKSYQTIVANEAQVEVNIALSHLNAGSGKTYMVRNDGLGNTYFIGQNPKDLNKPTIYKVDSDSKLHSLGHIDGWTLESNLELPSYAQVLKFRNTDVTSLSTIPVGKIDKRFVKSVKDSEDFLKKLDDGQGSYRLYADDSSGAAAFIGQHPQTHTDPNMRGKYYLGAVDKNHVFYDLGEITGVPNGTKGVTYEQVVAARFTDPVDDTKRQTFRGLEDYKTTVEGVTQKLDDHADTTYQKLIDAEKYEENNFITKGIGRLSEKVGQLKSLAGKPTKSKVLGAASIAKNVDHSAVEMRIDDYVRERGDLEQPIKPGREYATPYGNQLRAMQKQSLEAHKNSPKVKAIVTGGTTTPIPESDEILRKMRDANGKLRPYYEDTVIDSSGKAVPNGVIYFVETRGDNSFVKRINTNDRNPKVEDLGSIELESGAYVAAGEMDPFGALDSLNVVRDRETIAKIMPYLPAQGRASILEKQSQGMVTFIMAKKEGEILSKYVTKVEENERKAGAFGQEGGRISKFSEEERRLRTLRGEYVKSISRVFHASMQVLSGVANAEAELDRAVANYADTAARYYIETGGASRQELIQLKQDFQAKINEMINMVYRDVDLAALQAAQQLVSSR